MRAAAFTLTVATIVRASRSAVAAPHASTRPVPSKAVFESRTRYVTNDHWQADMLGDLVIAAMAHRQLDESGSGDFPFPQHSDSGAVAPPSAPPTGASWIVQHCGGTSIADDGSSPAECDPSSAAPCCGPEGVCGDGEDNCACENCTDYRRNPWAANGQCGNGVVGTDGTSPAQCDPAGENPCCSPYGWCGGTTAHCECEECIDYRPRWNEAGTPVELLLTLAHEAAHLLSEGGAHDSAWRQTYDELIQAAIVAGVGPAPGAFVGVGRRA